MRPHELEEADHVARSADKRAHGSNRAVQRVVRRLSGRLHIDRLSRRQSGEHHVPRRIVLVAAAEHVLLVAFTVRVSSAERRVQHGGC